MSCVVKAEGFDFDVGKEGVIVEQYSTSSVVGHVEPVREKLVVNILNRCDDMPLACILLLNSDFSSTSGSWIPVVDAELFLYR